MSNDQSVSEVVAAAAAATDTSNCNSSSSEPLQHKDVKVEEEEDGEIKVSIPQDLISNGNSTIETETDIKGDGDDDDGKPPLKRAKVDMDVCGDDIATPNPLDLPANSSSTATTSSRTDNNNNNNNPSVGTLPSIDNNNNEDENKFNNKGDTSNATNAATATAVDADAEVEAEADDTTGEETNATTSDNTSAQGLLSPAMTRSRASSSDKGTGKDNETTHEPNEEPQERWRVHQMAEDYVNFVGTVMYPATQLQPYGYNAQEREYPMEKLSMLGFLKSPLRRPTIMEKWSPYEIAIFEGSMLHYGKEFRVISSQIGTKTTRDVIDFYYIWKKTDHYKKWKYTFMSDEDLSDEYHIQSPIKKPKPR